MYERFESRLLPLTLLSNYVLRHSTSSSWMEEQLLYKFCSSNLTRAGEKVVEFISPVCSDTFRLCRAQWCRYQEDFDLAPTVASVSFSSALLMAPFVWYLEIGRQQRSCVMVWHSQSQQPHC